MTLLDDDSRAVLGLLRNAGSEPQQPLPRMAASRAHRAPLASDILNRHPKVLDSAEALAQLTSTMHMTGRPFHNCSCDPVALLENDVRLALVMIAWKMCSACGQSFPLPLLREQQSRNTLPLAGCI